MLKFDNLVELRKQIEGGAATLYELKEFSLASARTNQELKLSGYQVYPITDGSLRASTLRFNKLQDAAIPLSYVSGLRIPFFNVFLTTPAQTGKTLWLLIARDPSVVIDIRWVKALQNATFAGTTGDALADVFQLNAEYIDKMTIVLENNGVAALYWELTTNPNYDATGGNFLEDSGTLVNGDMKKFHLDGPYGQVMLQVRSNVAGAPTDYRGGYIANPI